MAVVSNLVRQTTLLPALSRAQLDFINSFRPNLVVVDIEKPHRDLWEITGRIGSIDGKQVVVFLTIDGKHLGNASKTYHPSYPLYATARRFSDWNAWPIGSRDNPSMATSTSGFYAISKEYGLLAELRQWCIDQVVSRSYPRSCDYYGRIWPEGIKRCPICGQPDEDDDVFPGPTEVCDHEKFSDELVQAFRNEITANNDNKED